MHNNKHLPCFYDTVVGYKINSFWQKIRLNLESRKLNWRTFTTYIVVVYDFLDKIPKHHTYRRGQTFYRFIVNHNTNQYDKIAMAIDAIHIGITVLSRYPTPNVRKPPFSVYIKPGFVT